MHGGRGWQEVRTLLDRDDELAALGRHLDAVREGEPHDLLVVGPAGLGKTALLHTATAAALDVGVEVLRATGGAAEQAFPWGVATQLLTPLLRRPDAAARVVGPAAPVGRLVAGEPVPEAAHPAFHLLHGIHWLLTELAEEAPVLLVVDDLHWADPQSAGLLRFLQRRAEDARFALLLAAREGEVADPQVREALASLAADPRGRSVALRPLSPAGAHTLAAGILGEGRVDLAARVADASGGNPHLCRTLAAAAQDVDSPQVEAAEIVSGLPSLALQALLQRRLRGLGEGPAAVGEALAVIGSGAAVDILAAVADLPLGTTTEAVDRLLAAGLVMADEDGLAFTHPVDQVAVLQGVAPAHRGLLHRRAAVAWHAADASPQVVAVHLLEAPTAELPWAGAILAAAAARHEQVGDLSGAVPLLRAALAEGPDGPDRVALLLRLSAAELATGDPAAATTVERAGEVARAVPDPGPAIALGDVLYGTGRFAEAEAAYRRVRADLPADPATDLEAAALLARHLAAARMAGIDADAVRQRIDVVADGAPAIPTVPQRVLLAAAAGDHALAGDRPADVVRGMVDRADLPGLLDAGLGPVVVQPGFGALWACDAFDEALAVLRRSVDGLGDIAHLGVMATSTILLRHRGRLAEAMAQAQWVLDVADEVDLPAGVQAPARVTLAMTALDDGDLAAARSAVGAVPDAAALQGNPFGGALLMAAGRLAHRQGRLERAVELLTSAGRVLVAAGGRGTVFAWRSTLGLALAVAGRREQALELVEEEVALAEAFGAGRHRSAALRARARLVADGAEGDLRRAVDAVADGQARLEHAHALVELGAAIRRAGRRREARPVLREGLAAARAIGLAGLAASAVEELTATGATRPALPVTGAAALTPTEARVARLAADGLSNRQIAETLVVSRKTVEFHLSGTYRKLGIARREQLADALG